MNVACENPGVGQIFGGSDASSAAFKGASWRGELAQRSRLQRAPALLHVVELLTRTHLPSHESVHGGVLVGADHSVGGGAVGAPATRHPRRQRPVF